MRLLAHLLLTGTAALACAALPACADDAGVDAVPALERTLAPGAALPTVEEPDEAAVTVSTPTTTLTMDVAGVETIGTVRATVYEPWLEEALDFQGVWLADLVDVLDPVADTTTIRFHALDDYEVSFDLDDIVRGDALLATRMGDADIPVADGGPLRLLFLDDGVGDNTDLWIWNIDAIILD